MNDKILAPLSLINLLSCAHDLLHPAHNLLHRAYEIVKHAHVFFLFFQCHLRGSIHSRVSGAKILHLPCSLVKDSIRPIGIYLDWES